MHCFRMQCNPNGSEYCSWEPITAPFGTVMVRRTALESPGKHSKTLNSHWTPSNQCASCYDCNPKPYSITKSHCSRSCPTWSAPSCHFELHEFTWQRKEARCTRLASPRLALIIPSHTLTYLTSPHRSTAPDTTALVHDLSRAVAV